MNYEQLLDKAYENVEVNEECGGRFEILKVKGHHEGTKTVISNFGQIIMCVRRKPEHLLKFLGKALGIQGEISGDRLILSRRLDSKNVNAKIEMYVNQYVLCRKCGKPDTELEEEGAKLYLRCLACGEKCEVNKI